MFEREKEQIITQYILHHEVDEDEVHRLASRLDHALEKARTLHDGQKRKTGEDYIYHPVRTAMEVSRFGRIIDWDSIEAAILHDTLEDTAYEQEELEAEFPFAAGLVAALTKIKDSRVLTYQKLFRFVLQDIRVLLVKIADRLDNLESLTVFSVEKQIRIAKESAEMYANICRRLCMLDLAERLTDKIGPILTPGGYGDFHKAQDEFKHGWSRTIEQLKSKLMSILPEDMQVRLDVKWSFFRPGILPLPENFFEMQVIVPTSEDAYRALGRIHLAFKALPRAFDDTLSTPQKNGYRALKTRVSYQGRIVSFYIASRIADRFNRLGLLSMDISSPEFNHEYLDDLREFISNDEMDIQDFLRFHRPDDIQVTSPKGDVFSLQEGGTALDYAFAVHERLGLKAVSARVNSEEVPLDTILKSGDRIQIISASAPAADERYLSWVHSRKGLSCLRRYMNKIEAERAATTGRQWLLETAAAHGISDAEAQRLVSEKANKDSAAVEDLYRRICLGREDINKILSLEENSGKRLAGSALRKLLGGKTTVQRRVQRYRFHDSHIRFCPICAPVEGDDIEGSPDQGRLLVHRAGCASTDDKGKIPLQWKKINRKHLLDPGPVEIELLLEDQPGVLHALTTPFKELNLDIRNFKPPDENKRLRIQFYSGSSKALNKVIRSLRKHDFVKEIKVFKVTEEEINSHGQ